jgi:hypothetical protein
VDAVTLMPGGRASPREAPEAEEAAAAEAVDVDVVVEEAAGAVVEELLLLLVAWAAVVAAPGTVARIWILAVTCWENTMHLLEVQVREQLLQLTKDYTFTVTENDSDLPVVQIRLLG